MLTAVSLGTGGLVSPAAPPDSIYGLRVDSAAHPNESYVYLLDYGRVRVERDGRTRRTYRQVIQLLRPEATQLVAEQMSGYVAGRQKMRLDHARVIAPDGRIVSSKPSTDQETGTAASVADPVYSDFRTRRISLPGISVGSLVDVQWTIEDIRPVMPEDFRLSWRITMGISTRRSFYEVDAPGDLPLRIVEQNLRAPARSEQRGGRTVYRWVDRDLPFIRSEPFAADSNDVIARVEIGAPISWDRVGRWYHDLAADRYVLDPASRARIAGIVSGASAREDSLRALQRWIAAEVRYVSVALAEGGYQPRHPREVIASLAGDCKDKATLFIAALKEFGITAYPVLLSTSGSVDPTLPSALAFDHVIAAVPQAQDTLYVDLTAARTRFGDLPVSDQGRLALLVGEDGAGTLVLLPQDSLARRSRIAFDGELLADGTLSIGLQVEPSAEVEEQVRALREQGMSEEDRRLLAASFAGTFYPGSKGRDFAIEDGEGDGGQVRISLTLDVPRAATISGNTVVLRLPFGRGDDDRQVVLETLRSQRPRLFPISIDAVNGGQVRRVIQLRLTVPEGWNARLPEDVLVEDEYGAVRVTYRQEGTLVEATLDETGRSGTLPSEAVDGLIAHVERMGEYELRMLVFEK